MARKFLAIRWIRVLRPARSVILLIYYVCRLAKNMFLSQGTFLYRQRVGIVQRLTKFACNLYILGNFSFKCKELVEKI